MYCSSCGATVVQGLSYCNHCGAKLNQPDRLTKSSEIKPESLVQGMIVVFVFGLGAIAVLLGVMKAVLGLNVGLISGFALLSFLIMIVLEGVFIRMLLSRKRSIEDVGKPRVSKGHSTNELEEARARILPEPTASVTEHTTRAFEPIRRSEIREEI